MNGWAVIGLGLVLGIRHAMDPDHVVAVAAMTARTRRLAPAMWLGAVWGLGHTLTLFVVGAAIILLNLTLPPRLGLTLEFVVAIARGAVGALNLGRGAHRDESISAPRRPAWRAFSVGLAHGLAGSAAVALLVLATVREPRLACAYLLVFGFGTVVGMVLVTTGFAAPLSAAARRWPRFGQAARLATGLLSLAFGAWLMVQIGFVDGLFLAHPHWTPH
jgi:ABC-type nickel/cobalt efflux system permease component RcnA